MTDYNRSEQAQKVFKEKRKPKGPIKFKISLNEEQKEAKEKILSKPYSLLQGLPGSGKTLLAVNIALDLFFKGDIEKIVITRPTVSKEDIGFLPGDLKEKMDPWLAPIYDNLNLLYDKTKIEKMLAEGQIEIVPFTFLRGRTFCNSAVVIDECQNITNSQTELMIGRLGIGSIMMFCGDIRQVDLPNKKQSGISFFKILEARCPDDVNVINLKKNHRHEAVERLIKVYEDYSD